MKGEANTQRCMRWCCDGLVSALSWSTAIVLLLPNHTSAGWFNEHKYIGDIAFIEFVQEHPTFADHLGRLLHYPVYGQDLEIPYMQNLDVRKYYNGMYAITDGNSNYSYGDLNGLAGDHTVDHAQMYEALFKMDGVTRMASGGLFARLKEDVLKALASHREGLENGKNQGDYFSLDYAILAAEDNSHFLVPGESRRRMLRALDPKALLLTKDFQELTDDFAWDGLHEEFDHMLFSLNNPAKYALLHMVALDYICNSYSALSAHDTAGFRLSFLYGLAMNAFADHYLQDSFASGHVVTKRDQNGLDNMGVHDYYNRVGLVVANERGEEWTTYGDNHYDSATKRHAIDATKVSLNELWEAFDEPTETSSLLVELQQDPCTSANWPSRIINAFNAFREAPVPLTKAEYQAKIEMPRGSKNGMFYHLDYGTTFQNHFNDHLFEAGFGLGYNAVKPDVGSRVDLETVLWVGLGVEYSFAHLGVSDIHRTYLTLHSSFNDLFVFEQAIGHAFYPAGGAAGRTSLGVEFKWLSDRLAPSLKVFADYERQRDPAFGLTLGIRRY